MRAAIKMLMIAGLIAAMPACKKSEPVQDQNIAIDNDAATPTDIEALPPDESSATPSNELENGSDNPDVNELNSESNSY